MPKKQTNDKTPTDKSKQEAPITPPKIILTTKCKTVSSKSTLTYNIAIDDKNKAYIRVVSNTGGGYFSNEWILIDDINSTLKAAPKDQPISSIHLFPLFKGKSVNTPGYLLAVLINEKVLIPHTENKRQYAFTGTTKLMDKIKENTKK
ncbi:MAG: hypothetical protein DIZ80_09255 [endosymbiont of Galathealinum brachiosum]|uniref:Uncharacterized protein n=1 Tax=endosymbiont of Galathealinum brachiosum TaxID=2200906 RepID=A0A370DC41_9GAMM|nr:MAG: hypothetical protein DIZ80_09255 [endosymbiont of Galathealinum brachiosum]